MDNKTVGAIPTNNKDSSLIETLFVCLPHKLWMHMAISHYLALMYGMYALKPPGEALELEHFVIASLATIGFIIAYFVWLAIVKANSSTEGAMTNSPFFLIYKIKVSNLLSTDKEKE